MLTPIRKLQLSERPRHICVSEDGHRVAICMGSGTCCLLDEELGLLCEVELGKGVEWVQLDNTGTIFVIGFTTHIAIFRTEDGFDPLSTLPVSDTSLPGGVFTADPQVFCIASCGRGLTLSAWEFRAARKIAEAPLPNRGDGNGYSLMGHPEGQAMAAIAYSGQSEEWMFWAHYADGRLRVFERPEMEGLAHAWFHPTGRELVSFHESLGFCRVQFPSGEMLASVQPEEAFPDNPDALFSYDAHFTRDDRVLVQQDGGALYEFDLATLRPIRTVLAGAEGLVFGSNHFYCGGSFRLARDRLLTTDSQFQPKGTDKSMTLRLWDASMLFGSNSSFDPSRPYTRQLLAMDSAT